MKNAQRIEELFKNITKIKIDKQEEFEQVGVWFDLYKKPVSVCYQNGDMNGAKKGTAIFNNGGADNGPEDIFEILKEHAEYQDLIDNTTYWKYEKLHDLINDFLTEFSERKGIDDYIQSFEH